MSTMVVKLDAAVTIVVLVLVRILVSCSAEIVVYDPDYKLNLKVRKSIVWLT